MRMVKNSLSIAAREMIKVEVCLHYSKAANINDQTVHTQHQASYSYRKHVDSSNLTNVVAPSWQTPQKKSIMIL